MSEQHNNHTPGYIPQIGVPDKNRTGEVEYHRAIYHKATAPGFFGVIILCFFMSFINIRCNGNLVDHYSGFDVIRGKKSSMYNNSGENNGTIVSCKISAYHTLEKKKSGEVFNDENSLPSGEFKNPSSEIPADIDATSSNPKTTRALAIIALICAACGAVLSLLKKYWGSFSQFLTGLSGFIALLLMQFYLKITVPKVSKPGSPLFTEYEVPVITTELAFGYWLALFLFLAVSVIGFLRTRYYKKSGNP